MTQKRKETAEGAREISERKLCTTSEHFLQVDHYVTQRKHTIAASDSCHIGDANFSCMLVT
jgi:hypothetical protein